MMRRGYTARSWRVACVAVTLLSLPCLTPARQDLLAQVPRESVPAVGGRLEPRGAPEEGRSRRSPQRLASGSEEKQAQIDVPALTSLSTPVFHHAALEEGERLVIEIEGEVRGFRSDSLGGIAIGALVASFNGGPMFLMGPTPELREGIRAGDEGRRNPGRTLLWTAPAPGSLAFAVAQDPAGSLSGGYRLRIESVGRRGDPRQGRFLLPTIAFSLRTEDAFLDVTYADRSGFGLDRKTLKVILDSELGERVVLSPYFEPRPGGATLRRLPPHLRLPPGVHRVTATIADALGNVSPQAENFIDQP
jgi:hypothetical protein